MQSFFRTLAQRRLFWAVFALGLALDLASKVWAEARFQPAGWEVGSPTPVHPIIQGVLAFKWAGNVGAAFSMLAGQVVLLACLGLVILCGLFWYVTRADHTDRLSMITLGLIGAGAVGNLWDRLRLGYVRDFIYFDFDLPFHEAVGFIPRRYPVFNVADIWIIAGAILLVVAMQRQESRRKRLEAASAGQGVGA